MTEFDRATGLGASEAPAALGLDPYASPTEIWMRKTHQAEEPPQSQVMTIGRLLEEPVARLYAERTGYRVQRHRRACTACRAVGRDAWCRDSGRYNTVRNRWSRMLDQAVLAARREEAEAADQSGLRATLIDEVQDRLMEADAGHESSWVWPVLNEMRRALAASAEPAEERCDVIVNNGMGEPIECGRTLPCEYHARPPVAGPDAGEGEQRPCPACGALLREDETHWSLFPEPMGGYVCPAPADPEAGDE